jgi:hypothetical protein
MNETEEQKKCLNCESTLSGAYCFNCGQKVLEPSERTFKYFFRQFFGAAFFLENNFLKNLWYLLVRPGFLAKEFLDGRRKRYMPPLSLFLLINLFYFMYTLKSDLNLNLSEQVNQQPQHSFIAEKMVDKRLAIRGVDFETYAKEYYEQSTTLSKSLVIVHVPIFALFVMLFYSRKKFYFMDHLIFSIYLIGFIILFSMLTDGLLYLLVQLRMITDNNTFQLILKLTPLVIILYFFLSVKKFYSQSFKLTCIKTISLLALFVLTHGIYRSILFFTTFWTT